MLSIAGLDPSSGAGLTADIKTLERLKCYGLAVCSGNTVQNDVELSSVVWTSLEIMKAQLDLLYARFSISVVKIGIVENWQVLDKIIDYLLLKNKDVKIVLDPVLSASSSFKFHESNDAVLEGILSKIYLITPNYIEIEKLFGDLNISDSIQKISTLTNLLLKGGHNEKVKGRDELYLKNGKQFSFAPKAKKVFEKHGSGCVLSSAIAAELAHDKPLFKACYQGKMYTEKVLASNNTLLGYHF